MNALIIFVGQLFITLAMSVFIVYLFKPYLKEVLKDTCGTEHSAAFWVRFTSLMMIIAPLVIVLLFSVTNTHDIQLSHATQVLKQTILQALVGEFIGLILVGRIIFRAINTTIEGARIDVKSQASTVATS